MFIDTGKDPDRKRRRQNTLGPKNGENSARENAHTQMDVPYMLPCAKTHDGIWGKASWHLENKLTFLPAFRVGQFSHILYKSFQNSTHPLRTFSARTFPPAGVNT
jgi:hypothetical protein